MSFIETALSESFDYYKSRVDRDIERNRKGNFNVTVLHDGKPVPNAGVSYQLLRHDFDFGSNIFMLDQYHDPDQQELYLTQWKKLFNTAVVPLYWEGTEPERGHLRYSADTPNDVYRRPPCGRVAEFCRENRITMKGHPLFWHEFIPRWLPQDWNTLMPLIEKRFREISERYADLIPVFDCVNEPSRLFDQHFESQKNNVHYVFPPEDYIEQIFVLARKYFKNNTLILNEATGAAFCEFRGLYGGHYLLMEKLLGKGVQIDRIGLQCHCYDSASYKNIFHSERLYHLLDGYAALKKPLVISEISISEENEELQAMAVERLYSTCFSHEAVNGIFWWNLDDNGILTAPSAPGENLPYGGLCRNGREKLSYRILNKLINKDWHTEGETNLSGGKMSFAGFYGTYEITVSAGCKKISSTVDFKKDSSRDAVIEI